MSIIKRLKLKYVAAGILCVSLCVAYGFTGAARHQKLNEPEVFHIYASCYPAYALAGLLIKDVPGMHLHMLTQPQDSGYTAYTLSDWETALINNADALIFFGYGFEAFAQAYSASDKAAINALSGLELKHIDDYETIDFTGEEATQAAIPWLYMTTSGGLTICESLCIYMSVLDEVYTQTYYDNLDAAYAMFDQALGMAEEFRTDKKVRVAAAHEAFVYPAEELGFEVSLLIRRRAGQTLSEEEISECIKALKDADINTILIEKQADADNIKNFEQAGFSVVKLDLMLDCDTSFASDGYFDMLKANMKKLYECRE
ncbi:MAG: zinc ABC transporter substrate-binding protein [Clostridia bacterium]|nr:zinc ABC transporter substrate-binding protein [Clostridia bacterium]